VEAIRDLLRVRGSAFALEPRVEITSGGLQMLATTVYLENFISQ